RAAVLPALARRVRGRGAPSGRARLLQRPDPQGRGARAAGAADGHRRGRARAARAEGGRPMTFELACAASDVPEDEALGVTIGRYDVAIARHGEEFFAVQDLCSHAAVALSEGEVEDCTVECWLH